MGWTMDTQLTYAGRAALLVIRAWCEEGEPQLRARIVEVPDLEGPKEVVSTTSKREEIHAIVDRWLDNLYGT